ncbi:MAG: iron response transcriptional regulator IrrA [Alphaproteobacteria bacterium]
MELQSTDTTRALERLRAVKLRPTRQRLALAQLLFDTGDHHVTAETLYDQAQAAGVRVSLATVYNTLHQFTAAGLLREVVVNSACTYFDTNVTDHHHFFYEDRGTLADIDSADIDIRGLPEAPDGAKISRVDVIIRLT